jgi:hypothetical protein
LYIEKDYFKKSQNYCSTGDSRTEYSSWRPPFPQKLSNVSFTNSTCVVGLRLINLWLLKVMLRCVNDGVMTIKLGIRQPESHMWYGQMSHPLRCSLHRKSLHLEDTQGNLQSWMPGSNSETLERFCDGLSSNIVVFS